MTSVSTTPGVLAELASTVLTGATNTVTSNNTWEDVTGFSLTVPASLRPYYVYLIVPYVQQNTVPRVTGIRIADNANAELASAFGTTPIVSGGFTLVCHYRSAATAASTIYKAQLQNTGGAGTAYFSPATTNPARLYALAV